MALTLFFYVCFTCYLLAWIICIRCIYRGARYKNESSLSIGLMILGLCLIVTMAVAYLFYLGNELRKAGQ